MIVLLVKPYRVQEDTLNDTQHERELTRRALSNGVVVDEELLAQQDAQPHYAAARKVEAERARRAEAMAESARRTDLLNARNRAAEKLEALNAELDAHPAPYAYTEAQFLGTEPMRVGYEDGAGHIIVGEAKIEPGPDGGFLLTIDDGQAATCGSIDCWCGKPKPDEVVEVLEGEVVDGSKPWIIGQDIPTEEVVETDRDFTPEYVQGYQDGVTDTHADAIGEKKLADEERGYAVDTEPAPVDQGNPSAHDLAIIDMYERKDHGMSVYGVTLQGGNGRDQLRDAYMEALDLVCYLRAALFERDGR